MADFEGNRLGNNTCNTIKGTDGHQFHRMLKQEEDLWIFNTDHCRSNFLVFAEEVEVNGKLYIASTTSFTLCLCRNWGITVRHTIR